MGSSSGRPCNNRISPSVEPLANSTGAEHSTSMADPTLTLVPSIVSVDPPKKKSCRRVALPAAECSCHFAPGAIFTVQLVKSEFGSAPHDPSGGGGGVCPSIPCRFPTIQVTSVIPPALVTTCRGMSLAQNIVKLGCTILLRAGRLSQTWNSSKVFGFTGSSKGNISACTTPRPTVSHCTSPAPYLALAPRESEWSTTP